MRGQIARRLYAHADRLKRHPNRFVRRAAQLAMLGFVGGRFAVRAWGGRIGDPGEPDTQMFCNPSFSSGLRDYLQAPGVLRRQIGSLARRLVLWESADARMRMLSRDDYRTFILRIDGSIDQAIVRNLLIWQNHVLDRYPGCADGRAVDVVLLLAGSQEDEPRLFELISAASMLERVRNLSVFWDFESLDASTPLLMTAAERVRWSESQRADDLRLLPAEISDRVQRQGTSGGIKLLLDGRRRVQDFLKAALPGRFIVAAALREDAGGEADSDDLDRWLPVFEAVGSRHPNVAFLVLNRLGPSRWQTTAPGVRFVRHQGLSLQDALCLAQTADGFAGVLDIFGLAANATGRRGVYLPLTDVDAREVGPPREDRSPMPGQIMLDRRESGAIEAALERFLAAAPLCVGGAGEAR